MKILILSDLHLEFKSFEPASVDTDVVVLAGDIWTGAQAIQWARESWPDKPIVYVAGNHEFYKRDIISTLDHLQNEAYEYGVNFLERGEVIIDGVRFLGCTLWTDFNLFGESKREECLTLANARLNDFRLIHCFGAKFTAEESAIIHQESRKWLTQKLIDEPFDGHTVVVTHHSPSWGSVSKRYQEDLLSACFSSKMEDLMGYSKIWIHGHIHESHDYEVNGTRIVCNAKGYESWDIENRSFQSGKIIEINQT